jgi:hypothetical protein
MTMWFCVGVIVGMGIERKNTSKAERKFGKTKEF